MTEKRAMAIVYAMSTVLWAVPFTAGILYVKFPDYWWAVLAIAMPLNVLAVGVFTYYLRTAAGFFYRGLYGIKTLS